MASRSTEAVEQLGKAEYTKWYRRGWRHSAMSSEPSLDNNPGTGWRYWAWEDGYMDYAGDRPKYHRRNCPKDDHNECETL